MRGINGVHKKPPARVKVAPSSKFWSAVRRPHSYSQSACAGSIICCRLAGFHSGRSEDGF
jgi:hypothetical protein